MVIELIAELAAKAAVASTAVPAAATAVEVAGVAAGAAQTAGALASTAEVAGLAAHTVEIAGAVETLPGVSAANTVERFMHEASASKDLASGVKGIEKLATMSDNLEGLVQPQASAITNRIEFTQEQLSSANNKVDIDLQKWDIDNPKPDSTSSPEAYREWCVKRDLVETDYIIDAKSGIAMREWEERNPQPDHSKDPEGHKKWLEDKAKYEKTTKNKIKTETEKLKLDERQHILLEIQKLKEDYSARMDIIEAIKALHQKENKTDDEKITLGKLQDRKLQLDLEIKNIELSLKQKQLISPPLLALIIATALAGMSMYKIAQSEGAI